MSHTDGKDPSRVAAGLKAATHNPNVSEEAKDNAAERLQHIDTSSSTDKGANKGADHSRVIGGYKATLKNPNVSEEAKEHAEEILEKNKA